MPSGLRKTSGNNFEIYYEQPWGGVASDKDPVDIAPNQLVISEGVLDINGALCFTNLAPSPTLYAFQSAVTGSQKSVPALIFFIGINLFALDQYGYVYILDFTSTSTFAVLTLATDGPWSPAASPSAVKVLNGIAYISVYGRNSIYTFNPISGVYALASNYAGGKVLGVLDDYLLQLNTNSAVDGPQPTRINWSGPGEFSTWDPSIDRTAGFNTLVNIDDALTGFISLASVGIAIGKKGLVQLSPTGIGIGPFSFTALWTSDIGQGCQYQETVSQYGQNTYIGTDTGIYQISTNGFTELSAVAREAIFESTQASLNVLQGYQVTIPAFFAGCVFLYAANSSYATPYYIFAGTTPQTAIITNTMLIVWMYNIQAGSWYSLRFSIDTLINEYNSTSLSNGQVIDLKIASVPAPSVLINNNSIPSNLIYCTVSYGSGLKHFIAPFYITNKNNYLSSATPAGNLNLVFRSEEIKLGYSRKPTIRRVVVKAYGSGTLNISLSSVGGDNTSFGQIVLDGTMNAKTYYSTQGVVTYEAPNLNINSQNFNGVIIKAMLSGAYGDGDID
jgi:hypothetical protein